MTSEFEPAFSVNFYLVSDGETKRTFRATCRTVPRRGELVVDPEAPNKALIVHSVIYTPEKLPDGRWAMVPQVHLRELTKGEADAITGPLR
jgi:hypothetical protein